MTDVPRRRQESTVDAETNLIYPGMALNPIRISNGVRLWIKPQVI